MKLINYKIKNKSENKLGLIENNSVVDLLRLSKHLDIAVPKTIDELLSSSHLGLENIHRTLKKADKLNVNKEDYIIPKAKLTYSPLIKKPGKILCVGMNYVNHIIERGGDVPISPIFFNKFPNTLAARKQEIVLQANAKKVDYEGELVIVIGKQINNVNEKKAEDAIFGYTIGNDVSDRVFQYESSQWLIGKSMDDFAPIGPSIVTKDSIDSVQDLSIQTRLNGKVVQDSSTKEMLFDVNKIVSYASQYMTLMPGDLIFTGTPKGVILEQPK
ncbi:MAG: fumarylacetoacetate hydrolase family protein [Staphylococcus equorum]|nr:fumarylacetoacetate hydrolase family protein [Staphylococcus equorum]